jgi:hypothetical protein
MIGCSAEAPSGKRSISVAPEDAGGQDASAVGDASQERSDAQLDAGCHEARVLIFQPDVAGVCLSPGAELAGACITGPPTTGRTIVCALSPDGSVYVTFIPANDSISCGGWRFRDARATGENAMGGEQLTAGEKADCDALQAFDIPSIGFCADAGDAG